MSKIIEPGKPPRVKQGFCIHCRCLFEFTDLDRIVYSALYEDKIMCPCCGKTETPGHFEASTDREMDRRKNFPGTTPKKRA